ncbi:MAG TPA: hypothetical protein VLD39_16330, partial [Gammaproteobacteria bacterium]|nr:hypothetical protein [Gammaproteobacteria bacterium]
MLPALAIKRISGAATSVLASVCCVVAQAQTMAGREEAMNMQLVGYNDLQGRSAYQPVVQQQGDRWIAYVGHHAGRHLNPLTGREEGNGTSILDVTDPSSPRYLHHLPGADLLGDESEAQMVRICAGSDLPSGIDGAYYMLRAVGNQGHEIWNVTRPEAPELVALIEQGGHLADTHKNWWECNTGIAYLVSG